jgi:iron complex transport system substrate-binding protein
VQTNRVRRGWVLVPALSLVASVAACSGDDSDAATPTSPASTVATTVPLPIATSPLGDDDTAFPVDVTDCGGRATTYERAPERVVVLDEAMAENLIQLGFRDSIVGVARYQTDDRLWPLTRDEVLSRQIINDGSNPPTMDDVERVAPDLVVAASLDTMDAVATRDEWTAAGMHTFVPRTACDDVATAAGADGLTLFYDDFTSLGTAFDAQLHSQKIIAQVQAHVDQVAGELARVGAQEHTVWVYGGADAAFDRGTPVDAMLRAVGLTVVGGDATVDLDAVAEADPDLIWIITPRGADPDEAAAALEAELAAAPELAGVSAIESATFVVTPADQVAPTPRMTDGLEQVRDVLLAMS